MISLKPLFASTAVVALMASACAAQSDLSIDDALTHRVIAGWTQADGSHMAALELQLAPGWKTYWRSPGDAGIPPQFRWSGARNVRNVHVHWPSPGIFWEAGMRSVGYKNTVVLPLTVVPKNGGQDMRLKGEMHLGLCADICVPASISIDADIPGQSSTRTPGVVAALSSLPFSAEEAGVRAARCAIRPTEDGISVQATITMPSAGGQEEAVIEPAQPGIWVSEPKTQRDGATLTVSAEMLHNSGSAFAIDRSALRITVIGGSHSVDIVGCKSAG